MAEGELIRWTARFNVEELRRSYGSMIAMGRLPERERQQLMERIVSVASDDLRGVVERPFVTSHYTARRP